MKDARIDTKIWWRLTMTAIFPWAATKGEAARAMRKNLESIFAVGGFLKKGLINR